MHLSFRTTALLSASVFLAAGSAQAMVTGDPVKDGWTAHGHSLSNGIYANGIANYGFEIYSATLTVESGSNLDIADGGLSWLPGDTVLGAGGVFEGITAVEAGWDAFSGRAVNELLQPWPKWGPKLLVKFGTSEATFWEPSLDPPAASAGVSSTVFQESPGEWRYAPGTITFRSSAYLGAYEWVDDGYRPLDPEAPNQLGEPNQTTWAGNAGEVTTLHKDGSEYIRPPYPGEPEDQTSIKVMSHMRVVESALDDTGRPLVSIPPVDMTAAARLIWTWNEVDEHVGSWQMLLNTSLLGRLALTDSDGEPYPIPGSDDPLVLVVQDRDFDFTASVIRVSPEPPVLPVVGDLNRDGEVDDLDLASLQQHLGLKGMLWQHGDFSRDGQVSLYDAYLLFTQYQATAGTTAAQAIPEPSIAGVMLLGGSLFLTRRRKARGTDR